MPPKISPEGRPPEHAAIELPPPDAAVSLDARLATLFITPPSAACLAKCSDREVTAFHVDRVHSVTLLPFGMRACDFLLSYSVAVLRTYMGGTLGLAFVAGMLVGFFLFWLLALAYLGAALAFLRLSRRPATATLFSVHVPRLSVPSARTATVTSTEGAQAVVAALWQCAAALRPALRFPGTFATDDLQAEPGYGVALSGDVLSVRRHGEWFTCPIAELQQVHAFRRPRASSPLVVGTLAAALLTVVVDFASARVVSGVLSLALGGACAVLALLVALDSGSAAVLELRFSHGVWKHVPAPSVEEARTVGLRLLQAKARAADLLASAPAHSFVHGVGRRQQGALEQVLRVHPLFVEATATRVTQGCLGRCACCAPLMVDWQAALLQDTTVALCHKTGLREALIGACVWLVLGLVFGVALVFVVGAAALLIPLAALLLGALRVVGAWCNRGSFVALGEPEPAVTASVAGAGLLGLTFGAAQWKSSALEDPLAVVRAIAEARAAASAKQGGRGGAGAGGGRV